MPASNTAAFLVALYPRTDHKSTCKAHLTSIRIFLKKLLSLKYNSYHRLKDLGVIFQLNLMSLTGHYGPEVKNTALYLLEKNYYELAGTEVQQGEHLALLQKTVFGSSIFNKIKKYRFKNLELLK